MQLINTLKNRVEHKSNNAKIRPQKGITRVLSRVNGHLNHAKSAIQEQYIGKSRFRGSSFAKLCEASSSRAMKANYANIHIYIGLFVRTLYTMLWLNFEGCAWRDRKFVISFVLSLSLVFGTNFPITDTSRQQTGAIVFHISNMDEKFFDDELFRSVLFVRSNVCLLVVRFECPYLS